MDDDEEEKPKANGFGIGLASLQVLLKTYVDFLFLASYINSLFGAIHVSIIYFSNKGSQGATSRTLLRPPNPLHLKWPNVPEPAG